MFSVIMNGLTRNEILAISRKVTYDHGTATIIKRLLRESEAVDKITHVPDAQHHLDFTEDCHNHLSCVCTFTASFLATARSRTSAT